MRLSAALKRPSPRTPRSCRPRISVSGLWLRLADSSISAQGPSTFLLPIRRGVLDKAVVALVLCSAVYFPVMWNSTGSLASPARAIKSQVKPTYRDATSDTYRIQENANLQLNIKQSAPLGKGYGVKIDYALPIVDISPDDGVIAWVPHNQVLDALMAMGFLGGVAVWLLIAAGIITGSGNRRPACANSDAGSMSSASAARSM